MLHPAVEVDLVRLLRFEEDFLGFMSFGSWEDSVGFLRVFFKLGVALHVNRPNGVG